MIRIIKLGNLIYENIEPKIVDENGNEIWNIPNDPDELRQALIDTVKWQSWRELSKTDWAVIKCQELGISLEEKYPEIKQKREQIRQWSNEKEEEIMNAQSLEELLNIDVKLPDSLVS